MTTNQLTAWADDVPLSGPNVPKWDSSIEHLIRYLLTVHKRFGNTTVTADIELKWGASAMWKQDAQKLEIAHLEAMLEDSARGLVKVREELKIIAARYEAALYRNDIY